MVRAFLMMAGLTLGMSSAGVQAGGCSGASVNFTHQVSTLLNQDRLTADLYAQRQAESLVELNRQLNQVSQQVAAVKQKLPQSVQLQTQAWRSWPVYDKERTRVRYWRGQVRYQLMGSLGADMARALQQLQQMLTVEHLQPHLSPARRTQVSGELEARLLQQARARLQQIRQHLGYDQARFVSISLDWHHSLPGPRPLHMLRRSGAKALPAPAIESGREQVRVSGRFNGCLEQRVKK